TGASARLAPSAMRRRRSIMLAPPLMRRGSAEARGCALLLDERNPFRVCAERQRRLQFGDESFGKRAGRGSQPEGRRLSAFDEPGTERLAGLGIDFPCEAQGGTLLAEQGFAVRHLEHGRLPSPSSKCHIRCTGVGCDM